MQLCTGVSFNVGTADWSFIHDHKLYTITRDLYYDVTHAAGVSEDNQQLVVSVTDRWTGSQVCCIPLTFTLFSEAEVTLIVA